MNGVPSTMIGGAGHGAGARWLRKRVGRFESRETLPHLLPQSKLFHTKNTVGCHVTPVRLVHNVHA